MFDYVECLMPLPDGRRVEGSRRPGNRIEFHLELFPIFAELGRKDCEVKTHSRHDPAFEVQGQSRILPPPWPCRRMPAGGTI